MEQKLKEKLLKRIDLYLTTDTNDCLPFPLLKKDGYGVLQYRDSNGEKGRILAHRFVYSIKNDVLLNKQDVILHKCDNPACCNPNHLKLGTQLDNVKDRVEKNRSAIGEKNGRSKLTLEQSKEIRYNNTTSVTELAKIYNVNRKVIYNIKQNKTWREEEEKLMTRQEVRKVAFSQGLKTRYSGLRKTMFLIGKQYKKQRFISKFQEKCKFVIE